MENIRVKVLEKWLVSLRNGLEKWLGILRYSFEKWLASLCNHFSKLLWRLALLTISQGCYGDSLSISQGPLHSIFSNSSANLKVKGVVNEFLPFFTVFRRVISFMYQKNDKVPLNATKTGALVSKCIVSFLYLALLRWSTQY